MPIWSVMCSQDRADLSPSRCPLKPDRIAMMRSAIACRRPNVGSQPRNHKPEKQRVRQRARTNIMGLKSWSGVFATLVHVFTLPIVAHNLYLIQSNLRVGCDVIQEPAWGRFNEQIGSNMGKATGGATSTQWWEDKIFTVYYFRALIRDNFPCLLDL